MKKYLLILVFPLFFVACNTHEKEMGFLNNRNDSLQKQIEQRDQSVNNFLADFNEIEQNLATIREKEKIISSYSKDGNNEIKASVKERIKSDLNDIAALLERNKKIIANLNYKLKDSKVKMSEFQKLVDNLNTQVADKDKEIEGMRTELASLNTKVTDLTTNVNSLTETTKSQQSIIEQKTTALNTAYMVVGTKQELKEKNIISKEGGFLGLGKTSSMVSSADREKFRKIDITQVTTIPINKKKIKLITPHPSDSYEIEKTADMVQDIKITNPEEFWSESKYLIAEVK